MQFVAKYLKKGKIFYLRLKGKIDLKIIQSIKNISFFETSNWNLFKLFVSFENII